MSSELQTISLCDCSLCFICKFQPARQQSESNTECTLIDVLLPKIGSEIRFNCVEIDEIVFLGYFVSFSCIINEKRLKGRLKTRGKSHCRYELPDLHVWLLISLVNFYRLFKTKSLLTVFITLKL